MFGPLQPDSLFCNTHNNLLGQINLIFINQIYMILYELKYFLFVKNPIELYMYGKQINVKNIIKAI